MKIIYTKKDEKILVDDEDYLLVSKYSWWLNKGRNTSYAINEKRSKNGRVKILMHRLIMKITNKNLYIDHIDGNGLNNQKTNLRICTNQENLRNSFKRKNNTSGYKGIRKLKRLKKNPYHVRLMVLYKEIHIGYFPNLKQAIIAYNNAVIKYFDKFAKLNKIYD